jgi:crotonobetainyl-CoA:carnitine CoA-transferase CaiB-like acyl-CoA transferase
MGQAMRFPWAPIQGPNEILSCPQLKARGFFNKDKLDEQAISVAGLPFKLSTHPDKRSSPAPVPGEHNLNIYRDELGIDEEEINELFSKGII